MLIEMRFGLGSVIKQFTETTQNVRVLATETNRSVSMVGLLDPDKVLIRNGSQNCLNHCFGGPEASWWQDLQKQPQ